MSFFLSDVVPAISMDLNPQRLNIIGAVSSTCEVCQIELNLVPALIQPHGHRADKWFNAGSALVVGGTEAPANILVIQNL